MPTPMSDLARFDSIVLLAEGAGDATLVYELNSLRREATGLLANGDCRRLNYQQLNSVRERTSALIEGSSLSSNERRQLRDWISLFTDALRRLVAESRTPTGMSANGKRKLAGLEEGAHPRALEADASEPALASLLGDAIEASVFETEAGHEAGFEA